MSISKKLSDLSGSADGRGRLATLASILVLASLLVLVMAVLPAVAGSGTATTTHNVQPVEVSYGGGAGACFADIPGRLPTVAAYELHINNPATGTYTGPDGTEVEIIVDAEDEYFDFTFVNNPAMAAFDVVVNGGSKNTHFDYDDHPGPGGEAFPGPQREDTRLHAPTKGSRNLYKLSHINICYDLNPSTDLSVRKQVLDGEVPVDPDTPFFVDEGGSVTFLITVTNLDNEFTNTTATNVVVTDQLPAEMTVTSSSPTEGSFDPLTNKWTGLELDRGEEQFLTLVVGIAEGSGGTPLENTASVASDDQTDPVPDNDTAASEPEQVIVNANLSGTVFVDSNANSAYDAGEAPESLTVRAYKAGVEVASTISSAIDGSYVLPLAPGPTYTVCLQRRDTHQQTIPDLDTNPPAVPGVACDETVNEPVGYSVALATNVSGKNFGNLPLFPCNEPLSTSGDNIAATFEIFANETYPICGLKGGSLTTILVDGVETIAFVLDGSGSTAARGEISKTNAGPDFVPLTYSPGEDGDFVDLPWCDVRPKNPTLDGNQFDMDLGNTGADDKYPSLAGVYDDPENLIESISCKVTEFEDILGNQTTVVFGEFLDPWYR